jgi:hypothetical protein
MYGATLMPGLPQKPSEPAHMRGERRLCESIKPGTPKMGRLSGAIVKKSLAACYILV